MDKVRKNLLGRNVTVKKETMSDGSLAKTRTVTSKKGGTISSKTSYKDNAGIISKVRSNRVENANKPKMSSKLDGTYQNTPIEGRRVGFSKETTYKEKNALGKPVTRERKVTPTANIPTVSGGFTVRKTRTTTGKDGVGSKVKFTEKKYDASGKLVAKGRVKYKTDASGMVKKGDKTVYREKGGSVLKKKNRGEEIIKATGRFAPKKK